MTENFYINGGQFMDSPKPVTDKPADIQQNIMPECMTPYMRQQLGIEMEDPYKGAFANNPSKKWKGGSRR